MKKIVLIFFLINSLNVGYGQKSHWVDSIKPLVTALYNQNQFSGSILYAENNQVLYQNTLGYAAVQNKQALKMHSAFNLASVSKQFFAMGILILQQKGKLSLNDSLRHFFPELPYKGVTIKHLLTHTSGIPEYFELFALHATPTDTLTNSGLIQLLAKWKPQTVFMPGDKWEYCNTNYALVASIIEKVAGTPTDSFLKKEIFEPLQLNDTYVFHLKMNSTPKNRVQGFRWDNNQIITNDLMNTDGLVGDGNIYASVLDLQKWLQSLITQPLVSKTLLQEAFQPVKLNNGTTYPYGYGWFIDTIHNAIWHTGSWVGFKNFVYQKLDGSQTIIALTNGSNGTVIQALRKWTENKSFTHLPTSIITNVSIIDGNATPAFKGAVRLQGNKIIAVGQLQPFAGEKVINGNGKTLVPGFIDTHSHIGSSLQKYPNALACVNQGVTTIVIGQDGQSYLLDTLKQRTLASVNVATYVGHTTLREMVMGKQNLNRPATEDELNKMKQLLASEMQKGALGLSTGLEYEGAYFSSKYEVIELAKVAAAYGGTYISHMRSEDVQLAEAIDEIIDIGKHAKIPVQISHFKIGLRDSWGTATNLLAKLEMARQQGITITADCYPYEFWNSTLKVLFPKTDYQNLQSATYAAEHTFSPEESVLVTFAPNLSYQGKTIAQIAAIRHMTVPNTLIQLIAEADAYEKQHPDASHIETIMGKSMINSDVCNILSWSHTNLCSDGAIGGHPRAFGSFTRFLGVYVRQKKLMNWETAIHKMTAMAAEHVGISHRGIIAPGYFADLVLLDTATVADQATIAQPQALSKGILKVWVNGQMVYQNQAATGIKSGQLVLKNK